MAAGLAATPLHAQVRDTARAAARTGTGRATAQARAAQDTTARDTVAPVKPLPLSGTIVLSASLGRLSFGAFQTQGVELSALDSLGNALETQSFERTLGAGGAYSAAMGVTYWATERWGARIEAGWSRPRLAASLSRAGQAYRFQHGGTGEPAAAFPLLSAAAEALFRLPIRHPVYTPYVLAGAGLRRYGAVSDTTALPAGGRTAFTRPRIVFMTLFGLGALVRLHGDHWLLQVEFQHR
ncbi:MAG TPA: hypothetical protein VJ957_04625, partial [Longimicrobiales bacterium]|nr:hypothetical protein [Longimicrobiales bacterium]